MDGVDTAALITKTSNTKIAFLTGNLDAPTYERAVQIKPSGIIFKPINEAKCKTESQGFIDQIRN